MAPHDSASFFPSSVFTSRLQTQHKTGGMGHWVPGGGHSGRGRDPQSPPYLCRDRSALFPTSTTGMLRGMGRMRARPPPGSPLPRRDSTYRVFPRLSYSLL